MTSGKAQGQNQPTRCVRVIAWPAFKNRSGNPYNWLLYSHVREHGISVSEFSQCCLLREQYDVFHLHWPEGTLNFRSPLKALAVTLYLFAMIDLARARNARLVWTVHNLATHERRHPTLEDWFWRRFVRRVDGYISPSQTGRLRAEERFPSLRERPGFVVPLGHYRDIYPDEVSKAEARLRLGLPPESKVLAYLGRIRPYKNIPHLVRTFRELPGPELVLLVAGRPSLPSMKRQLQEARGDPRVRLFLEFVPDEAIQNYLKAADMVVFPYTEVLNSSSSLLALSFNRPILVPDRGALDDLQAEVGKEWVKTYAGDLTPAILSEALAWALYSGRPEKLALDQFAWHNIARKTVEAYRSICSTPQGR